MCIYVYIYIYIYICIGTYGIYMRNLWDSYIGSGGGVGLYGILGWLETRLARNSLDYLKIA